MHGATQVLIALFVVAAAFGLTAWWASNGEWGTFRQESAPWWFGTSVIFTITGAIWGLVFIIMVVTSAACINTADKVGLESEYSWLSGCFVEINGELVPYDLVRLNEDL